MATNFPESKTQLFFYGSPVNHARTFIGLIFHDLEYGKTFKNALTNYGKSLSELFLLFRARIFILSVIKSTIKIPIYWEMSFFFRY